MKKLFQTAGVAVIFVLSSFAQSAEPVPAPADVILQFSAEADQHQFHLGELIPVKFSYIADVPSRYVWVSQSEKLAGGRALEISCSPAAERINSLPPSPDLNTFAQMLNACGGVGGGVGGGCADCDWEQPLSPSPVSFGPVPLNRYIRFRTPGIYTCDASAAGRHDGFAR